MSACNTVSWLHLCVYVDQNWSFVGQTQQIVAQWVSKGQTIRVTCQWYKNSAIDLVQWSKWYHHIEQSNQGLFQIFEGIISSSVLWKGTSLRIRVARFLWRQTLVMHRKTFSSWWTVIYLWNNPSSWTLSSNLCSQDHMTAYQLSVSSTRNSFNRVLSYSTCVRTETITAYKPHTRNWGWIK